MGAVWQHIVFNEYLPSTLGTSQLRRYGLQLRTHGYYNGRLTCDTHTRSHMGGLSLMAGLIIGLVRGTMILT